MFVINILGFIFIIGLLTIIFGLSFVISIIKDTIKRNKIRRRCINNYIRRR